MSLIVNMNREILVFLYMLLFVIYTYPKPHFHELLKHPAPHLSLWMESTWHLGIQTLLEKMDTLISNCTDSYY